MKRIIERMMCAVLVCAILMGSNTALAASSVSEISKRLEEISKTSGYTQGSTIWGPDGCFKFANAVSRQLFGVDIPHLPDGCVLKQKNKNWTCIGQIIGGTNTDIKELLKKAQVGDHV